MENDFVPVPNTTVIDIPGIDTAKGIAMTGGTAEGYRRVLSMFRKDTEERMQKFRFFLYENMVSGNSTFPEKHLSSFITQIHALKSASATIGAAEVSAEAAGLEEAGKTGDLTFIQDSLGGFMEHLAELVENILTALEFKPEENEKTPSSEKKARKTNYISIFNKLKNALKSQNVPEIEQILNELSQKPPDSTIKKALEQISDQVLMAEFNSAIKTIDELENKKT